MPTVVAIMTARRRNRLRAVPQDRVRTFSVASRGDNSIAMSRSLAPWTGMDLALGFVLVAPGQFLGVAAGPLLSLFLGLFLGVAAGPLLSLFLGLFLGVAAGPLLSLFLGLFLGVAAGPLLSLFLGLFLGVAAGPLLSLFLGLILGVAAGPLLSLFLGLILGVAAGPLLGVLVTRRRRWPKPAFDRLTYCPQQPVDVVVPP